MYRQRTCSAIQTTHKIAHKKTKYHNTGKRILRKNLIIFLTILFILFSIISKTKISYLETEMLQHKIETDEKYTNGVAEARELEKEKQHGTVEELKLR